MKEIARPKKTESSSKKFCEIVKMKNFIYEKRKMKF